MDNKKTIITAEEEQNLLRPIDEYIGKIQEKINALRENGTDKIISLNNHIAVTRENANYTKDEKAAIIAEDKKALVTAKAVEQQNKEESGTPFAPPSWGKGLHRLAVPPFQMMRFDQRFESPIFPTAKHAPFLSTTQNARMESR